MLDHIVELAHVIFFETAHEFGGRLTVEKIFVAVCGGSAYVMEDTVPSGFEVEIIDFDNIEAGDGFPSEEAREYCAVRRLYEPRRALRP